MKKRRDTKFKPGICGNETTKWKPGQSGNPAGKSKRRMQFEESFNEALITGGGPDEAAKLLWEAARRKEPWAIQELCRRFAPQTDSMRMIHEVNNDETIDYSRLSDEQIRQLEAILAQSRSQSSPAASGKGPA